MRATRPWLVLAPIPATAVGAMVARAHGVPLIAFLPNLLALVVGAAGFLWLTRASRGPTPPAAASWPAMAAALAIAATLAAPGISGVHRWLPIGPLRINASAALAPWLFLLLTDGDERRRRLGLGLAVAVQAVHLMQPDAAQATALALGALPLIAGRDQRPWAPIGATLLLLGLAIAWTRPDPLPAHPHVERILALAMGDGPFWIVACTLAAAGLFVPALVAFRSGARDAGRLGASVALYLGAQLAATVVGHYPVPGIGAGAGPLLGWWGLTVVCFLRTR